MTLVWAPSFSTQVSDPDAQAYIEAVETQDTQPLEVGVAHAINTFVLGCKADGIWDAIKASCILAGARTLSGALVPLKGTAPTNNNFVSGDYNRETGLVGDGSTKWLDSNRTNNADPQDSKHLAVYVTSVDSRAVTRGYIGASYTHVGWSAIVETSSSPTNQIWVNSTTLSPTQRIGNSNGFTGACRESSSVVKGRNGGSTTSFSKTSQSPSSGTIFVFATNPSAERTTARLSFYSIGESLDLAALDNRVTTLMTDIGAAIP